MARRHGPWTRTLSVVVVLMTCQASTARAAERFWITPGDGFFDLTANWSATSGGASGASVPVATDNATFDLNATYVVTLSGTEESNSLTFDRGTVTFQLGGNTYTLGAFSSIDVGRLAGQTARFTITNGTLAVDLTGNIIDLGESTSTAQGFLTIAQNGTLGSTGARPAVNAGDVGLGTFTIEDGGDAFVSQLLVGSLLGSNGTLTVRDLGSTLDVLSTFNVGSNGIGAMTVSAGGRVTASSTMNVGSGATASGTVSITGVDSEVSVASTLLVGSSGNGTLTVSAGGLLDSTSTTLGSLGTGSGAVTVTGAGSTWDLGVGSLTIGSSGIGSLTVSSGSTVTGGVGVLGNGSSGIGHSTVTGSGSTWHMTSAATVGNSGSGELTIASGGEVTAVAVSIASGSTGVGVVDVSGPGSRLVASSSSITVAGAAGGDATLNVSDGAEVVAAIDLVINNPTGTQIGRLNFDGGSILVGGAFTNNGVFNFTDGLLQVIGNFQPNASAAPLVIDGDDLADLPTIELLGTGTTSNVTSITVGDDHQGQLRLRQGRQLNNGASGVNIGADFGGEGTLVVETGAFLSSTGTIAVGGAGLNARGTGKLQINGGGTVDASVIQLHAAGTVELHGGRLIVDSMTYEGQFDWTTGTLLFDSLSTVIAPGVAAALLGPEQTLRPGQTLGTAAVGQLMTLQSTLTVAGGRIEADSFDNFGTLKVFGDSTVTATVFENLGTIELSDSLATVTGATQLANSGIIRGTGRIDGIELLNEVAGSVEVVAGQRLVLPDVTNAGRISVIDGELQTINMDNVASTGLISARDAILRFAAVQNSGGMAFSNGTVDVYGDVTQNVGGRITVSGGGLANFYDDVTISPGAASVQASKVGATVSTAVFFGSYNGGNPGMGDMFIEGDHRPGNSAGLVTFGGNLGYGPFASLEIELGGTTPGTQFDQVIVANDLFLDGSLSVSLIDPFSPSPGQAFEIIDVGGLLSGTFTGLDEKDFVGVLGTANLYITYAGGDGNDVALLAALPGDYDVDGDVDGRDFLIWQRGGSPNPLSASDLADWQANFGAGSLAASHAVPEPSCLALLISLLFLRRTRK